MKNILLSHIKWDCCQQLLIYFIGCKKISGRQKICGQAAVPKIEAITNQMTQPVCLGSDPAIKCGKRQDACRQNLHSLRRYFCK